MKFRSRRGAFAVASSFAALIALVSGCRTGRIGPAVSRQPPDELQPPQNPVAERGFHLFLQNCAHCHGDDAHGDEGPDLHGVTKSDEKIARIIQGGIKGEMPKFGAKFTEADVKSLIAFIRSLD